ncbi:nuclear transport factor 2 (NTF2) family protein isoform X2 [Tasmannia lanceolata]|uniref:nuclear transport factor 2 (NTF2) family protein isoform X2 n=1 Tax=Tasmannia lanceolata TaxID=3420 RepID=UPI0040645E3A
MQGASSSSSSLLHSPFLYSSKSPLILPLTKPSFSRVFPSKTLNSPRALKTIARVSTNQTAEPSSPPSIDSASDVVREFYGRINGHDLSSVEDLIAENCVYEDLIFSQPFVGRKAILEFFKKFTDYISIDLQFVIDNISNEDSSSIGVTWHLEWQGRPFPFSKGCSFYHLELVNGRRQIIYGRDSVEPAFKPGESALVIIRGVTWLLQRFPQLVDHL